MAITAMQTETTNTAWDSCGTNGGGNAILCTSHPDITNDCQTLKFSYRSYNDGAQIDTTGTTVYGEGRCPPEYVAVGLQSNLYSGHFDTHHGSSRSGDGSGMKCCRVSRSSAVGSCSWSRFAAHSGGSTEINMCG